ncbi:putative nucleotidyltransferase substrate binding domain-containing protein [Insolitispirillum peregrinum]|uniref:CBS domain-containing protein n=1 Tax=Insolitispirillum peregrinum TaxID=80876 RepID=A0A1N7PAB4_9PROT|nr:putative nucleotidyltransferase substrate binding domain-containing protein [Insolitispirillum peregrinum]SIT07456.1 CBS domain-containing protein [Insolitispirillum peregrinum]
MSKDFDFSVTPFSHLSSAERGKLSAAVDIAYFKTNDTPLKPGQALDHLMLVIKGLLAEKNGDELVTVHGQGDLFGASALINDTKSLSCEVQEEALVYLIPRQMMLDLCRSNSAFEAFFTSSLSERLAARANAESARGMASFMVAKVGQAYLHPPLFVPGSCTLRDAAVLMKKEKATSLLVTAADGRVGVLSGSDMRDHAIIQGKPLETPVESCATYGTITVDQDEFLFNAQVLMTRYNIRRLPVLRDGNIIGVLELIDLLGYMSSHSHLVAVQVDRAQTLDELRVASEALGPLLQGLHGSGVKIRFIAEMVTDLSRKIQRKLFEMLIPPELAGKCCLMVMGSEGRGEQIAKTDQDNALIIADDIDPDSVRDLCRQYTEAMISFGYPPCSGNMMVSNPEWSKTESQFRDDIYHWMLTPGEKAFLNLAAFIDGEAVAGDPLLLYRLRSYLFQRLTDNQGFLSHFARPVNSFDTPIGFFHQLVMDKDHKGEIDIKKGGIFPIVHGVRALALEKHLTCTSTFSRIEALGQEGIFDTDFAANLVEAFQFLMEIRLQGRLSKGQLSGEGADNFVRADDLSKFQQDALKDSLLLVKQFKQLLTHHFKLAAF